MRCAWTELLAILPTGIRADVDQAGKEKLTELRLRVNSPPELVLSDRILWLQYTVTEKDLSYIINAATHYSPWSANSSANGYITAYGGHRIGLCGEAVVKDGMMTGMRSVRSVCIRVARDYLGIGKEAADLNTSVLILGSPGSGKTTLLRDVIRQISSRHHVAVVDERCELFPDGFKQGLLQDTIQGCTKKQGIERVLRTMGPEFIAVDEVTAEADANSLIQAGNCGVKLIATAHAGSMEEFFHNKLYQKIQNNILFPYIVLLDRKKNYTLERMKS